LNISLSGPADGLQEANSYNSELVRIVSSQGLAVSEDLSDLDAVRETYSAVAIEQKILDLKELLFNTRPGTPHHSECLDRLAGWYKTKFSRTDDIADIDESIKNFRPSLGAADSNDMSRSVISVSYATPSCPRSMGPITSATSTSQLPSTMRFSS